MSAGTVLLIGSDDRVASAVATAIGQRTAAIPAAAVLPDHVRLTEGLPPEQCPALVVITAELPVARALAITIELRTLRPDVEVVLVGDLDRPAMLEALRAGVVDISPAIDDPGFLTGLRARAGARSDGAADGLPRPAALVPGFGSRTVTVLSPKGGVGKTSLSANMAVALAEQFPQQVALVDLDLQFGDVSTLLDLEPKLTLADYFDDAAESAVDLQAYLTSHASTLKVLCGADSPAANERVSSTRIATLLRDLQQQFRFVVVDTAAGLDEATLAALEVSHEAVVVSSMDMTCLRSLRKAMELLDRLSLMPARRHVVVNFADRHSGLRVRDVEGIVGAPADVVVPRAREVTAASNRGVPVVNSARNQAIGKAIRALADRVAEGAPPVAAVPAGPTVAAERPTRWEVVA